MNPIRIFAAAVLALGLATAPALAQDDQIATAQGPLIIHPIHHAAIMLTWNGKHILVDPAPNPMGPHSSDPTAEYKAMPRPDVILITHIHGDHFNVPILQAVSGKATIVVPQNVHDAMPADLQARSKVMTNGQTATVDGIAIEAMPMYNTTPSRMHFHPKGLGNGYVLTLGGKRIYIAGDTEEDPTLAHLKNIDVAFIPMNLPYTETVEAAAKWVRDFRPKNVYPYHYRNGDGSLSDVNKFKTLVGSASDVRLRNWYPRPSS